MSPCRTEIPSDIIDDILDYLESDFDTLKSVSFTSRVIRHLAQKRLFRTVYLNCYSPRLPNLRLLARASVHNPLLSTYVHHLKITISQRDFNNEELIHFMSKLTRVRALHLLNNAMLFSDNWSSIPIPFRSALNNIIRSIETLRLENIVEMPLSNLAHSQNLKTLILMDTTLTSCDKSTSAFNPSDTISQPISHIQDCVIQFSLSRSRSSRASRVTPTINALATLDLSKLQSLKFITNRTSNLRALEQLTRNAQSLDSFKLQVLPSHHDIRFSRLLDELSSAVTPLRPSLRTLELALCGVEDELGSLELIQGLLNPFREHDMLQEFHLRLYLRDEEYDMYALEEGLSDLRQLFRRKDLSWPAFKLASASVMNLDDGILYEDHQKQHIKPQRSNVSFLSLL